MSLSLNPYCWGAENGFMSVFLLCSLAMELLLQLKSKQTLSPRSVDASLPLRLTSWLQRSMVQMY